MPINKNELTKEMIAKAMQCETAEDLVALAKSEKPRPRRIWRRWMTLNWMTRC